MDYLDEIDKMSLTQLLEFAETRNAYKEMLNSAENLIAEAELRYDCMKEEGLI